jgi:hypothetical protein
MTDHPRDLDPLTSFLDEWEERRGVSFGETSRLDLRVLVEGLVNERTDALEGLLASAKKKTSAEVDYLRREWARANARLSAAGQRTERAERRAVELERALVEAGFDVAAPRTCDSCAYGPNGRGRPTACRATGAEAPFPESRRCRSWAWRGAHPKGASVVTVTLRSGGAIAEQPKEK